METKKEELIALITYMIKHNESHNKELNDLAISLKELDSKAYEKVGNAIEKFEEGNDYLSLALKELNKD